MTDNYKDLKAIIQNRRKKFKSYMQCVKKLNDLIQKTLKKIIKDKETRKTEKKSQTIPTLHISYKKNYNKIISSVKDSIESR